MTMYLGDFAEDATVRFGWSTNDDAGASVTRATNGTVSVYKDGGTTQSTAGVTDTEDFDSLTGVHLCVIDTSADAFYAAGSEYMVVLSAATIDGQTVNHVLAHFSIERAGGALALLKNATYGLSALETLVDGVETTLATVDGKIDTIDNFLDTEVAAILEDTNELQTDWADGGRLDLILDARASASALSTVDGKIDTIDTNVDAILVDTAEIGAAGAGLTAVPWNASWDAEVQSEVQDAIEANHLDHLLAATYDPASKPGAADALLNELVESDSGVARFTANALEQGPGGGSAPSAADIADAVLLEAVADHSGTAGSLAAFISNILTDTAEIGAAGAGLSAIPWNAAWDAEVQSECNDALIANGLDHLVAASVTGTDVVDNSIIAKMVSKSATADWDSFANTTDALEAIRDKQTDIETDTQDIQSRLPAALTGAGNIKADVLAISGDATAADNLEAATDGTGYNIGNGSVVAASVTGNVGGTINGLTATAKGHVNDEVLDVLNTDTFAEPGQENPPATTTLVKKIGYLYKMMRNRKTQTATTFSLYADDATTVDQKSTVADDGSVASRSELASGP